VTAAARRLTPHPAPAFGGKINIVQGEQYVSDAGDVMISTLLGSCVAACLRDPVRGIGGMNHFLLPPRKGRSDADSVRFGVHAMELLVNALLAAGAKRDRLECKLFGGAHMLDGLADVGRQNSDFALSFLNAEGIRYLGGSLGGTSARRVQFWPASGRARQLIAGQGEETVFAQEIRRAPAATQIARDSGDVELF
jgi:chemotaxis protein CheD